MYELATGQRAFPKKLNWATPPTANLPEELRPIVLKLLETDPDRWLRIPMPNGDARSLNLSNCAAIVLFEALRQTGFATASA